MTEQGVAEKAVRSDAEAILRLEKICFERDAWAANLIEEEISGGFARRATVVRNRFGEAVAYCISRIFAGEMQIFKIAVHPLYRRKGLAQILLRDAFGQISGGGVSLEVATDNFAAISLYSKMGFKKISVRENYYSKSGRDAFVMSASLAGK